MVVGEHPGRILGLRPPLLPKLSQLAINTTQHAAIVVGSGRDDVAKRLALHLNGLADVRRQPFFTRGQPFVDALLKPLAESRLEAFLKPLAESLETFLKPLAKSLLKALFEHLALLLEPFAEALFETCFKPLALLLEALPEPLIQALLELPAERDKLIPNFISQCPLQLVEAVGHLVIPRGRHRSIVLRHACLRTEGHVE